MEDLTDVLYGKTAFQNVPLKSVSPFATVNSLLETLSAINALPFAKATAPGHVLAIDHEQPISGQDMTQNYPKLSEAATA